MSRNVRAPFACATLLFLALVVACGPPRKADDAASTEQRSSTADGAVVGKPAPAFTRRSLDGATVTVPSGSAVTVVLFWATWSSPDMLLLTKMQEISLLFPDLAVIAVSVDEEEERVAEAASSRGARYPIVWDAGHTVAQSYKMETDPETFVLDKQGIVRFIHRGYHDGESADMEAEIGSLLKADICKIPPRASDGPACFRQCARMAAAEAACTTPECRTQCAPRACRETCERDNKSRKRALAECRQEPPKAREACEAACHGFERNNAVGVCEYQSGGEKTLLAECASVCGVGVCLAKCR